ncbi:MAG TPA: cytochrome c oxidase subunit II [Pirellulales bacterium]|jgi:cytochrome c oxidase subunit 2|nr:cytochrome c oxidase subunit II [Pirellulales bacterium]
MLAEIAIFPPQASTTAEQVDKLLYFLVAICGSMGLLVAFLLIFFAVRYRRRPQDVGTPPETESSRALEWFWTITPGIIFVFMFVWGAEVYFDAYRAPDDATPIYVIAKQWMWKFQHPEGQREINTLHVPIGRPVKMLLTSEDVIHSFFVPAFRVHMDVLPDRYTSVWFEATQPGEYHLFCSQYCGTNHSGMIGKVVVMEPADYEDWLHLGAEGSLALEGRKTFLRYRCISCHSADEHARAPVLERLYGQRVPLTDGRVVVADESYIRQSILDPSAKIVSGWTDLMPTFRGQVSEEELIELIAFFRSLAQGGTPSRVEDYPAPVEHKTKPAAEQKNGKP